MKQNDDLGDRMKSYEARETDRKFMNFAPVIARMDGRGFSRWTAGLERPFDIGLTNVMTKTTKDLVEATNARIGYTQSDEITLVFLVEDIAQSMMFDGKVQKLCSILASLTTSRFIVNCLNVGGELAARVSRAPHFDTRVFQVPTKAEAANAVLWRERDAAKNAVSMAARSFYPHKELQGKNSSEMQEMIFAKGMNFNDYPSSFKRGSFVQARTKETTLSNDIRERLRKDGHACDTLVVRRSIEPIDMPIFSHVKNREAVIFDGEEPQIHG